MEFKGIKQPKQKVILMKVTSRERPETLISTIQQYISKANDLTNMVWLFTLDEDDTDSLHAASSIDVANKIIHIGTSTDKINAINRDVECVSTWDILLNISDDQIPVVKGYDDIIRSTMPESLDASIWFYDGGQMRINTQEILGRAYYNKQGFIYDPRFKSFFCDNLATMKAEKEWKLIKDKRCLIQHCHPGWHKVAHIKLDALYEKNDKYWKHDEDLFNQLVKEL